jgi:hypothetical protein
VMEDGQEDWLAQRRILLGRVGWAASGAASDD